MTQFFVLFEYDYQSAFFEGPKTSNAIVTLGPKEALLTTEKLRELETRLIAAIPGFPSEINPKLAKVEVKVLQVTPLYPPLSLPIVGLR